MSYLIIFGVILIVLVGPSLWVKGTMRKYSQPDDRYPFTGAVFAGKLLKALNIKKTLKLNQLRLVIITTPLQGQFA